MYGQRKDECYSPVYITVLMINFGAKKVAYDKYLEKRE